MNIGTYYSLSVSLAIFPGSDLYFINKIENPEYSFYKVKLYEL
jgi:hypothetical protein